ncbi:type VII toxin-antitoxin system MntA family adenylyltransferase antitoxin [Methylohalobius crimeensis]|uniref:type VII toxin-antitoxin system MntA family adenylyltransferase antitoxin n=1 Tax=Methylohalobius crimeensis TaxID=244365 RepID=UPI0003B60F1C|nr:nucleotidyltransferase domain-containing protein [Methylohalobius crimeensis]
MIAENEIVRTVLTAFPATQAIYLFGSWGTENEWPDSDVDIAVLLPPETAQKAGSLTLSELRYALERLLDRNVDLINLRRVSTVFQKEIVMADRRIFCGNRYAADEFEMLVLSLYQKLNQERAEVLADGLRSGRFYQL